MTDPETGKACRKGVQMGIILLLDSGPDYLLYRVCRSFINISIPFCVSSVAELVKMINALPDSFIICSKIHNRNFHAGSMRASLEPGLIINFDENDIVSVIPGIIG